MKIRVVLSTPDRKRFVCWFFGHDWNPVASIDPARARYVCRRCLAFGEAA